MSAIRNPNVNLQKLMQGVNLCIGDGRKDCTVVRSQLRDLSVEIDEHNAKRDAFREACKDPQPGADLKTYIEHLAHRHHQLTTRKSELQRVYEKGIAKKMELSLILEELRGKMWAERKGLQVTAQSRVSRLYYTEEYILARVGRRGAVPVPVLLPSPTMRSGRTFGRRI